MSSPLSAIIDATLGAVFVGFSLSCVMFGIFLALLASYFKNFPGDKAFMKFVVILVTLLELADQVFIGHLVYFYAISNYGNPIALAKGEMTWSFIMQLLCGCVAGIIVKAYFALRVWRFSGRNIWITGIIMLLAMGQLGLTITYTIQAFNLPNVFEVEKLQTLGTIALGVGVLTDVVTASALCLFLNRLRTGLSSSDSLVKSLVKYAINTGGVTSAVSISVVILYNLASTSNFYFVAVYFNLSKLYAISFMATLNTRRVVRGRGTDKQGNTTNNTNMFHLGTRMPSLGPEDLERWDKVDPPTRYNPEELQYQGRAFPPPTARKYLEV